MAVQAVITPLKDAIYGGGEPTGEAHARMKMGMYLAGVLDSPTMRPPTEAPTEAEMAPLRAAVAQAGLLKRRTAPGTGTDRRRQHATQAFPQGGGSRRIARTRRPGPGPALAGQAHDRDHPLPPGGTLETVGRMLAQKLGQQLGQTVIVDNRPSGAGTIGAAADIRNAYIDFSKMTLSLVAVVTDVVHGGKPVVATASTATAATASSRWSANASALAWWRPPPPACATTPATTSTRTRYGPR